jgi:Zn-dependent protease with chaperone function
VVNFFDQQAAARKRTTLCVVLYGVAVAAVTLCVVPVMTLGTLYLSLAAESKSERSRVASRAIEQMFDDPIGAFSHGRNLIVLVVAVTATLGLIFGASLIRYASLRRGGAAVAEGLGARRINAGTRDLDERRLLNVVEEMALASSVPVPAVYVMEEEGVNAFVAGHSPSDAVVAVTRGTLRRLNREQLQGVVAHEFSHILNGDMRLNLRLIGLLYGIVCVSLLGRVLLQSGDSRRNALPVFGIVLLIIGGVGAFFARLIKAMISRQREYLADASAVQFTRNPDGIAGALKVIGAAPRHGRLDSRKADECSHMMFVSSVSSWVEGAMATHPPLENRIRRLDPHWDGKFLGGRATDDAAFHPADAVLELAEPSGSDRDELLAMLRPTGPGARPTTGTAGQVSAAGTKTLEYAGGLTAEQVFARLNAARTALSSIPDRLVEAARDAFTARSLLLAMLLDSDPDVRQTQLAAISGALGPPTAQNTLDLAGELERSSRGVRLPLIDLSVAALGALSFEQYKAFRSTVKAAVNADDHVDLFELCLEQVLVTHLDRKHLDARPVPVQYYALHRLGSEVATLLKAVAAAGRPQPGEASRLVNAALGDLALPPAGPDDATDIQTDRLVAAMSVLRSVAPRLRARVLAACAAIVGADGRIDPQESELLRAIADTLDLPLALPVGIER